MRQAFLFLSCQLTDAVISTFNEIATAADSEKNTTCILFHQKDADPHKMIGDKEVFCFSDKILFELGYKPLGEKLIPGNNHFPLLKFYKENPHYDFYWCIEDDVRYTGSWAYFFSHFENSDISFISSHMQRYADDPQWPWWATLAYNDQTLKLDYLVRSFNPIYRISNEALSFIDQELLDGWQGHHEVLFPSLLSAAGFNLMDFGGRGEFVPKGNENKFYFGNYSHYSEIQTIEPTFRWRPIHEKVGQVPNKLYHPVKE